MSDTHHQLYYHLYCCNHDHKLNHWDVIDSQLWLYSLRHACICKNTKCNYIPKCNELKKLSKHISQCKKVNFCTTANCFHARYLLGHYADCSNEFCRICEPIRSSIMLEYAKSKNDEKKEDF